MERLSRNTDPSTSASAAAEASARLAKRAEEVLRVMSDGIPRIDEEIHAAMLANGYRVEMSSARHGRKVLADKGLIEYTGTNRRTKHNRESMEWRIANGAGVPVPARRHRKMPKSAYLNGQVKGVVADAGIGVDLRLEGDAPEREPSLTIHSNGRIDVRGTVAIRAPIVVHDDGSITISLPASF